ncbi:unnamed protein product [Amoebophrya sp. A120]|nr:unnamed protein product [Amoebophrya sp. A120]|eukprot:GSA120T00008993001.1
MSSKDGKDGAPGSMGKGGKSIHNAEESGQWSMSVEQAQAQFLGDLMKSTAWMHKYGCVLSAVERGKVLAYQEKWKKLYKIEGDATGKSIKELCSATPDLPVEQPNGLVEFVSDPVKGTDFEGVPYRCRRTGKVRFYVRRTVCKYAPGELDAAAPEQWDLGTDRDGRTLLFHNQNVLSPAGDPDHHEQGAEMEIRLSVLTSSDPSGKQPLTYFLEPDPSTILS